MSVQSIKLKTINSLKTKIEKDITNNANKYLLQRRFMLGKGYCRFTQHDNIIIHDMIQRNNCDVLELINKVINDVEQNNVIRNNNCKDCIPQTTKNIYHT